MTRWAQQHLDALDPSRVHDQTTASQAPARRQLARERTQSMDEGDVQADVIAWAWSHPDERLRLLRAYPADGPRVFASGLVQGTPDLLLPVPSGDWHMLWLELKHPTRQGADLSRAQYVEMRRLIDAGHAVDIAWTPQQAKWVLTSYLTDPDSFLPGY